MNGLATLPPELAIGLGGLIGLLIGSFLNVVVHRLPAIVVAEAEGREAPASLAFPASHCPKCGSALRWRENLPLLSYLIQRGRCRHCAAAISWRYPALEALGAVLAAVAVWRFGPTVAGAAVAVYLLALLTLAAIDLETGLLPDRITLPLLWLGLILAALGHAATPGLGAGQAILGAAAGYAALDGLNRVTRLCLGREGMGGGDAKLAAAMGAWLGPVPLAWALLLAFVVGSVYGVGALLSKRAPNRPPEPRMDDAASDELPFGPWLALGGAIFVAAPEAASFATAWWARGGLF